MSDGTDLASPLALPRKSPDGYGHEEEEEKMGIDEMLQRFSGEFGRWQLRHFVLTSLAWALEAFHTMVMIFADREPAWRCTAPGAGPRSCGRVVGARTVCELEAGTWEWVGGPGISTVAEWGLVCGERYKVGLAQAAFFAGCMVVNDAGQHEFGFEHRDMESRKSGRLKYSKYPDPTRMQCLNGVHTPSRKVAMVGGTVGMGIPIEKVEIGVVRVSLPFPVPQQSGR
ncbi:hypothetical protein ACLOJK_039654 [Asimina triloba]